MRRVYKVAASPSYANDLTMDDFDLSDENVASIIKNLSSKKPIEVLKLAETTVSLYKIGNTYTGISSEKNIVYRMMCRSTTVQGFKAQVVESPRDVDVRNIRMPVVMGS